MDQKELKIVMECPLKYILQDADRSGQAEGEATARLTEDALEIKPKLGESLLISLRDIHSLAGADYKLNLLLSSGETLLLYHLGYRFEDFVRSLSGLRNEQMLKDLLMEESVRRAGLNGMCSYSDSSGQRIFEGKCEVRLYETALVILPENNDPLRIPYSFIDKAREQDYALDLETEFGENLVLSRLGRDFEPLVQSLSGVMNELTLKVQKLLKDLLPEADPALIRQAARLMKEGKAVPRYKLEEISPWLWTELERRLTPANIRPEYDFLSSIACRSKISIGVKQGLLGDLTGLYTWFLIPIYSTDHSKPGNAVAMEAVSGEGGKATYFFRLTGRKEYRQTDDIEVLHQAADTLITRLNRCMLTVNFRREPVYLPEQRLNDPPYIKYKTAIRKIPALQELRKHFIGRVFHKTPEQWEQDVLDLLKFNVSAETDDCTP